MNRIVVLLFTALSILMVSPPTVSASEPLPPITDAQTIEMIYEECLGRPSDPSGLGYWQTQNSYDIRNRMCSTPEALQRNGGVIPAESIEYIKHRVRMTFPESPDRAVKITKCESSFNPQAIGKADNDDTGILQVNVRIHRAMLRDHGITREMLLTLEGGLWGARLVWEDSETWRWNGGWGAWVCNGLV